MRVKESTVTGVHTDKTKKGRGLGKDAMPGDPGRILGPLSSVEGNTIPPTESRRTKRDPGDPMLVVSAVKSHEREPEGVYTSAQGRQQRSPGDGTMRNLKTEVTGVGTDRVDVNFARVCLGGGSGVRENRSIKRLRSDTSTVLQDGTMSVVCEEFLAVSVVKEEESTTSSTPDDGGMDTASEESPTGFAPSQTRVKGPFTTVCLSALSATGGSSCDGGADIDSRSETPGATPRLPGSGVLRVDGDTIGETPRLRQGERLVESGTSVGVKARDADRPTTYRPATAARVQQGQAVHSLRSAREGNARGFGGGPTPYSWKTLGNSTGDKRMVELLLNTPRVQAPREHARLRRLWRQQKMAARGYKRARVRLSPAAAAAEAQRLQEAEERARLHRLKRQQKMTAKGYVGTRHETRKSRRESQSLMEEQAKQCTGKQGLVSGVKRGFDCAASECTDNAIGYDQCSSVVSPNKSLVTTQQLPSERPKMPRTSVSQHVNLDRSYQPAAVAATVNAGASNIVATGQVNTTATVSYRSQIRDEVGIDTPKRQPRNAEQTVCPVVKAQPQHALRRTSSPGSNIVGDDRTVEPAAVRGATHQATPNGTNHGAGADSAKISSNASSGNSISPVVSNQGRRHPTAGPIPSSKNKKQAESQEPPQQQMVDTDDAAGTQAASHQGCGTPGGAVASPQVLLQQPCKHEVRAACSTPTCSSESCNRIFQSTVRGETADGKASGNQAQPAGTPVSRNPFALENILVKGSVITLPRRDAMNVCRDRPSTRTTGGSGHTVQLTGGGKTACGGSPARQVQRTRSPARKNPFALENILVQNSTVTSPKRDAVELDRHESFTTTTNSSAHTAQITGRGSRAGGVPHRVPVRRAGSAVVRNPCALENILVHDPTAMSLNDRGDTTPKRDGMEIYEDVLSSKATGLSSNKAPSTSGGERTGDGLSRGQEQAAGSAASKNPFALEIILVQDSSKSAAAMSASGRDTSGDRGGGAARSGDPFSGVGGNASGAGGASMGDRDAGKSDTGGGRGGRAGKSPAHSLSFMLNASEDMMLQMTTGGGAVPLSRPLNSQEVSTHSSKVCPQQTSTCQPQKDTFPHLTNSCSKPPSSPQPQHEASAHNGNSGGWQQHHDSQARPQASAHFTSDHSERPSPLAHPENDYHPQERHIRRLPQQFPKLVPPPRRRLQRNPPRRPQDQQQAISMASEGLVLPSLFSRPRNHERCEPSQSKPPVTTHENLVKEMIQRAVTSPLSECWGVGPCGPADLGAGKNKTTERMPMVAGVVQWHQHQQRAANALVADCARGCAEGSAEGDAAAAATRDVDCGRDLRCPQGGACGVGGMVETEVNRSNVARGDAGGGGGEYIRECHYSPAMTVTGGQFVGPGWQEGGRDENAGVGPAVFSSSLVIPPLSWMG